MDQNDAKAIHEELSRVITLNSVYRKSVEIIDSLDPSIFPQVTALLTNLLDKDNDYFALRNENFSLLLLFLLEHIPLEIDLDVLLSHDVDYSLSASITRKTHQLNLLPSESNTIRYSSESQHLLGQLYKYLRVKGLEELLLFEREGRPIYRHCLDLLAPFLSKTNYDQYPIAVQIFVHIIKAMRQSPLSEMFDFIFPVCLMTLDDPSIDMKFISLDLLDHLQRHCTTTELSLFNRSNVIMFGLEQNLHHRGGRINFFQALLATSFRWLRILENETYSGKHLFLRTSQLMARLIRDSLLETNIHYRGSLIQILQFFVLRLDLFATRHLKDLMQLIDDSVDNRHLRDDALQLLLTTIDRLQPRINTHRFDMMKILIRCSMKLIHEEKDNAKTFNLMGKGLNALQSCTTENYVRDSLQSLIETSQLDVAYRDHLQRLLGILGDKPTTC